MSVARLPVRRGGEVVAYALVDARWERLLADYRWWLAPDGYVVASPRRGIKLRLSRVIAGLAGMCPGGREIDHRNGDKLDNRRANLRVATRQQNGQNVPVRTGRYRGVHYQGDRGRRKPWRVRIGLAGRYVHVGYYATEDEAGAAAAAWYAEHMPFAEAARSVR